MTFAFYSMYQQLHCLTGTPVRAGKPEFRLQHCLPFAARLPLVTINYSTHVCDRVEPNPSTNKWVLVGKYPPFLFCWDNPETWHMILPKDSTVPAVHSGHVLTELHWLPFISLLRQPSHPGITYQINYLHSHLFLRACHLESKTEQKRHWIRLCTLTMRSSHICLS